MNKDALVKSVAGQTGFSQKDVANVLNTGLDTIVSTLEAGEEVSLQGHVTFGIKDVPARTRRNPQNGQAVSLPAGKKVHAKLGSKIKNAVR